MNLTAIKLSLLTILVTTIATMSLSFLKQWKKQKRLKRISLLKYNIPLQVYLDLPDPSSHFRHYNYYQIIVPVIPHYPEPYFYKDLYGYMWKLGSTPKYDIRWELVEDYL